MPVELKGLLGVEVVVADVLLLRHLLLQGSQTSEGKDGFTSCRWPIRENIPVAQYQPGLGSQSQAYSCQLCEARSETQYTSHCHLYKLCCGLDSNISDSKLCDAMNSYIDGLADP